MMKTTGTSVEGASKAYRKVNNLLGEKMRIGVKHSGKPSKDFVDLLESARTRMDKKALAWYRRGIVRGIAYATERVLDGSITLRGKVLTAPGPFKLRVKTRIDGREERHKIIIKASEAGFR